MTPKDMREMVVGEILNYIESMEIDAVFLGYFENASEEEKKKMLAVLNDTVEKAKTQMMKLYCAPRLKGTPNDPI